jgi:hypothetical protein
LAAIEQSPVATKREQWSRLHRFGIHSDPFLNFDLLWTS